MIKTATNATFIVMTKAQAAFMQALNIVVALKNKNTTMLLRQKSPFALSLARCIVLVVIFYTVVLWGYVVRGFCIWIGTLVFF